MRGVGVAKRHRVLHQRVGELLQLGQAEGGRGLPVGGAVLAGRHALIQAQAWRAAGLPGHFGQLHGAGEVGGQTALLLGVKAVLAVGAVTVAVAVVRDVLSALRVDCVLGVRRVLLGVLTQSRVLPVWGLGGGVVHQLAVLRSRRHVLCMHPVLGLRRVWGVERLLLRPVLSVLDVLSVLTVRAVLSVLSLSGMRSVRVV